MADRPYSFVGADEAGSDVLDTGVDYGFNQNVLDAGVGWASSAFDSLIDSWGGGGFDPYGGGQSLLDSWGGMPGDSIQESLLAAAKPLAQQAARSIGAFKPITYDPNSPMVSYVREVAKNYGLDPELFVRQLAKESGLNPKSPSSSAGAVGIAQFMPATGDWVAQQMGVSREQFWMSPELQIQGAAWLMRYLMQKYGGDKAKALAAYNAGEGAVDKYGGVPPIAETQHYVNAILGGMPAPGTAAAMGTAPISINPSTAQNPQPQGWTSSPVTGNHYTVSFGYGEQYDKPITGANGRLITHHEGIDLVRPDLPNNGENAPVTPFRPGTVTAVGADNNGKYVVILGDDGFLHVYVHLNAITVGDGQRVDTTTPIGILGQTGTEGAPHLHYGVRTQAGVPVDPTPFLSP